MIPTRRQLLALAVAVAACTPGLSLAQAKLKVAAIYTVPFEQQWVSRLHDLSFLIGYLSSSIEWAATRGEPEAWRDMRTEVEAELVVLSPDEVEDR